MSFLEAIAYIGIVAFTLAACTALLLLLLLVKENWL